ncbi:hypothetical protein OPQ81_012006 [Rhizoctonia solani]|nr:hypothetical protein OPQ81_012006 [Rhizoctonia solani]
MEQQLRFNICSIESSFQYDDAVDGLQTRIAQAISPTLSYTAHNWGDHLQSTTVSEGFQGMLESFLSAQLLLWMEVLNLKCTMKIGIAMLSGVKMWLTTGSPPASLVKSLDDSWLFLIRQTSLLATWGKSSQPLSLAFSSDNTRIAVRFSDGTVVSQDAHYESLIAGPLKGHSGKVSTVAFSSDGSMIASGSEDCTIIVWDAHKGVPIVVPLLGHDATVASLSFSPDGARVISGSSDHTTRIWGPRNGSPIGNSPKEHLNPVNFVVFSPNGKLIACGLDSDVRTMSIWEVHWLTNVMQHVTQNQCFLATTCRTVNFISVT